MCNMFKGTCLDAARDLRKLGSGISQSLDPVALRISRNTIFYSQDLLTKEIEQNN